MLVARAYYIYKNPTPQSVPSPSLSIPALWCVSQPPSSAPESLSLPSTRRVSTRATGCRDSPQREDRASAPESVPVEGIVLHDEVVHQPPDYEVLCAAHQVGTCRVGCSMALPWSPAAVVGGSEHNPWVHLCLQRYPHVGYSRRHDESPGRELRVGVLVGGTSTLGGCDRTPARSATARASRR